MLPFPKQYNLFFSTFFSGAIILAGFRAMNGEFAYVSISNLIIIWVESLKKRIIQKIIECKRHPTKDFIVDEILSESRM